MKGSSWLYERGKEFAELPHKGRDFKFCVESVFPHQRHGSDIAYRGAWHAAVPGDNKLCQRVGHGLATEKQPSVILDMSAVG